MVITANRLRKLNLDLERAFVLRFAVVEISSDASLIASKSVWHYLAF